MITLYKKDLTSLYENVNEETCIFDDKKNSGQKYFFLVLFDFWFLRKYSFNLQRLFTAWLSLSKYYWYIYHSISC